MHSLVFLCLLVVGIHSHGQQFKIPSIYTPVSPTGYPDQYSYAPTRQFQSQEPAPASYNQPLQTPFPQQPIGNYFPPQQIASQLPTFGNYYQPQPVSEQPPALVNYFQPQPQQPLYPPNSLVLVYYRAKTVQKDLQLQQEQTTKPRVETAADRFANICKGEGITSHPDDCLKFIRCKLSLRNHVYYYEERSCPRGLAFDPTLESCNYQARVSSCAKVQFTSQTSSQSQSAQPTQTLLTYHGDLPESEKAEDSNPTFYIPELPQPLSDSSEEVAHKPDHGSEGHGDDTSIAAVPLTGKNADGGVKSPPPATKTVKKPVSTKKSPSRKTVSKRPTANGTKTTQGTKSKPVAQEKELEIQPSKKMQQVETFSIGDSTETARMMVDNEEKHEVAVTDDQTADDGISPVGRPAGTLSQAASGVQYEDDSADDETFPSSV